ncbi:MAG: hypothetical protein ACI91J_001842, partial [Yoonia sp.]
MGRTTKATTAALSATLATLTWGTTAFTTAFTTAVLIPIEAAALSEGVSCSKRAADCYQCQCIFF